jgi:signal transduction histidine kinase
MSLRSEIVRFLSFDNDPRLSLRRFLLRGLGFVVLGAVMLLVVGITTFVYQTEARSWEERENEVANNAAKTVDLFMQTVQNYMGLFSRLDSLYMVGHPETVEDLLQQMPALMETVRLDPNGRILISNYQDTPTIVNLFTIPQSSWFRTAQSGQTYLGDVQLSADNKPYMLMAIPVADGGVIAVRLQMDVLWNVVSQIHSGRTGQAYIVNSRGEIVAHPDAKVVLNHTTIANRPEFETILQSPGNRYHGLYTNFNGVDVVASSASIPNSDWIVITEVSRSEAFATTWNALAFLGGGVLFAGVLLILLTSRLMQIAIFKPIENLRSGVERIGRGDLDYRIEVVHQDEIGEVAESFNEMAARLSDREAALEEARDEALRASQFKGRLLANVGHDLRTPINSILGYADILNEGVYGSLTDQQRKANSRILSSARRLLNLINSILDQAQIDVGKLVLHRAEYKLSDLLTAIRDTWEIPAQSKGLELAIVTDSNLPQTLFGDQQRVQQIVMNLVENSLKFTLTGKVAVRVYCADGDHWAIEVSDTGPGISPEAQEYIFEPFRQVDGSTTRGQQGVGLGLSIVKQLALLMDGEVQLASEPGKGSTFTILLPLNDRRSDD